MCTGKVEVAGSRRFEMGRRKQEKFPFDVLSLKRRGPKKSECELSAKFASFATRATNKPGRAAFQPARIEAMNS